MVAPHGLDLRNAGARERCGRETVPLFACTEQVQQLLACDACGEDAAPPLAYEHLFFTVGASALAAAGASRKADTSFAAVLHDAEANAEWMCDGAKKQATLGADHNHLDRCQGLASAGTGLRGALRFDGCLPAAVVFAGRHRPNHTMHGTPERHCGAPETRERSVLRLLDGNELPL